MTIKHISEMPHLKERLRYDSSRCHYVPDTSPMKGNRSVNVENTVLMKMQGKRMSEPFCEVNDIIKGVARLDHYTTSARAEKVKTLSVQRLYAILQCMPVINTREVVKMFDLGERQARRYVQACKIAMPHLERTLGLDAEIEAPDFDEMMDCMEDMDDDI